MLEPLTYRADIIFSMENDITYREASPEDMNVVHQLVGRVFNKHVAPNYSVAGIKEFLTYIDPATMVNRLASNHFMLIAKIDNKIAGVIEMRNNDHVSLLFVSTEYQGKGIARKLFELALKKCKENFSELKKVSVNSSPNAVSIYERLGFRKTDEEQLKNGIRFTPMRFTLQN